MRDPVTGQLVAGFSNRDPFSGQLTDLGPRDVKWRPVDITQILTTDRVAMAAAGTWNIFRQRVVNRTPNTIYKIRLVKVATFRTVGGNTVEYPLGNDYSVVATTEPASPNGPAVQDQPRTVVTWRDTPSGTVVNSRRLESDDIDVIWPPGEALYIRGADSVGVNGQFAPISTSTLGLATGYGQNTGEGWVKDVANNTQIFEGGAAIPVSNNNDGDGFIVVAPSSIRVPGFLGDSIIYGLGDSAGRGPRRGSYVVRAMEILSRPCLKMGLSSDTLQNLTLLVGRPGRTLLFEDVDDIYVSCGHNDVYAGRSLASMKADVITISKAILAKGKGLIWGTVLPMPTSVNGYLTVAGQTKINSVKETSRIDLNAWMLDPSASGMRAQVLAALPPGVAAVARFGATIDICAPIECDINGVLVGGGGYVLPSPGGILATGTLTAVSDRYTVTDNASGWTENQWKGKSLCFTSGPALGKNMPLREVTAAGVMSSYEGVADGILPTVGNTYIIHDPLHWDAQHPGPKGYEIIGASFAPRFGLFIDTGA